MSSSRHRPTAVGAAPSGESPDQRAREAQIRSNTNLANAIERQNRTSKAAHDAIREHFDRCQLLFPNMRCLLSMVHHRASE